MGCYGLWPANPHSTSGPSTSAKVLARWGGGSKLEAFHHEFPPATGPWPGALGEQELFDVITVEDGAALELQKLPEGDGQRGGGHGGKEVKKLRHHKKGGEGNWVE